MHINKLQTAKRAQMLNCLCEGKGVGATSRLTDAAINTVVKLLVDAGNACARFQDETLRNLNCKRLQCDEVWSFCYGKDRNCTEEMTAKDAGIVCTWAALDPETKLIPCWYIGKRNADAAYHFMHDLASRLSHRVQMTTDASRPFLFAVEDAFGAEIDYAQLVKIYGTSHNDSPEARHRPTQCMGARKAKVIGKPAHEHVSTSWIERQNLTMGTGNPRFTHLTNAFCKKVKNHERSVALHFMHYNFCRVHTSLRVTPAMEAGVSDHVWSLEEVLALLD